MLGGPGKVDEYLNDAPSMFTLQVLIIGVDSLFSMLQTDEEGKNLRDRTNRTE